MRFFFRALWLRGFLPAIIALLWTVPSMHMTLGWQWYSRASGGTFNSDARRLFIGYGTCVFAWGPGFGARPGESTMGYFYTEGFTFRRLDKWGMFWYRPRWLKDQIFVPLWMFALALAVPPAAIAVKKRFSSRPGLCKRCRYSLAGLPPNAPCPECGAGTVDASGGAAGDPAHR